MNIKTVFLLLMAISNSFCVPPKVDSVVEWEDTLAAKLVNPLKGSLIQKTISGSLTKEDIARYTQETGNKLLIHELLDVACRDGNPRMMLLLLSLDANLHAKQETLLEWGVDSCQQSMVLLDDAPVWSAVRKGDPAAVQILLDWSTKPTQELFSARLIKKLIKFVDNRVNYYEQDDYEKIMTLLVQYLAVLIDQRRGKEMVVLPIQTEERIPQSTIEHLYEKETTVTQPGLDSLTRDEQQLLFDFVPMHSFNDKDKPEQVLAKNDRLLLYQVAVEQKWIISQQLAEILTSLILNSYKSNAAWHLGFIVQKYPEVFINGGYNLSVLLEILEKHKKYESQENQHLLA